MKRRRRQGIKRRIVAHLKQGATLAEAARREGVCRATVYNWKRADARFRRELQQARGGRKESIPLSVLLRALRGGFLY